MIKAKEKESAINKTDLDKVTDLALKVLKMLQEQDLTIGEADKVLNVARAKLGDIEYGLLKEARNNKLSL